MIRKQIKKTEKDFYIEIDKEILKKKYDRAILTKAKRLAKGKEIDAYYIDLRFEEMMEEYNEKKIQPLLAEIMKKILNAQKEYHSVRDFQYVFRLQADHPAVRQETNH